MTQHVYTVPRDYREYRDSGIALLLPEGADVAVKDRVVLFDKNLDFTQHDVIQGGTTRVVVGPAIKWPRRVSNPVPNGPS